jgi:urease accessory protein
MKHLTTAVLLLLLPTSAVPHVGAGDSSGFVHGFLHPFGGIDHVLVVLSVGLGVGLGLAIGTVARSHRRRIGQLGGGAIAVAGVALLSPLV